MVILPNPAQAEGRILFSDPVDWTQTDILSYWP
jgi:hypothetical protein